MTASTSPDTVSDGTRTWPFAMRALHWTVALLFAIGFLSIVARDWVEAHDLRGTLLDVHKQIGLIILTLTLLRIGARIRSDSPRWLQSPAARFAAIATHLATYALLISLPVLGWLMTNAKGKPLALIGIPLPRLVARDRDFAETIESIHTTLGWALLALIVVHILAALWHHWFAKDHVLNAMLGRRAASAEPTAAASVSSIPAEEVNE